MPVVFVVAMAVSLHAALAVPEVPLGAGPPPFGAGCDHAASDVGRVELALAERAPVDGIRSAVVVISAIELVGDSGRVPLLERPVVTGRSR